MFSSADTKTQNGIDYGIQFIHTKTVDDEEVDLPAVNLSVTGTQINRDLINTGFSVDSTDNKTISGAKYAIARTFQQNLGSDGYIAVPNMKPYFIRQVNKSIKNATLINQDGEYSEEAGVNSIKDAVASMSDDLTEILDTVSYSDDTYADDEINKVVEKDTSPLFTFFKNSSNEGLTELTGTSHTTFNGENLYNANVLKNPTDFIKNFSDENIKLDDESESNYGKGAINKFYDANIANNDESTKSDYPTNYSADAVQKKRDSLDKSFGSTYDVKYKKVAEQSFSNVAPKMTDVFLGTTEINSVYKYYNDKISEVKVSTTSTLADKFFPDIDNNTHIVTMKDGYYFADGSSVKTFSNVTANSSLDFTNNYVNKDYSYSSKNSPRISGSNKIALIYGNMTVSGSDKNIDIGQSGNSNNTLIVNGNISCTGGQIQVRSNSTLYVKGDITCKSLLMEEGAKIYCGGTLYIGKDAGECGITVTVNTGGLIFANGFWFDASGSNTFNNYGTVLVSGDFFSWSPIENYGTIKCAGTFTIKEGKDNNSIVNNGEMYIEGKVECGYQIKMNNGTIYAGNDVYATNTGGTNIVELINASTMYVRGVLSSTSDSRHIWIHEGEGAVLSVYGSNLATIPVAQCCFGEKLVEFANQQTNSTIYLGTGVSVNKGTVTIKSSNTFSNYGTLYCYGSLQIESSKAELSGDGKTYIEKDLTASNAIINVSNNHTLVCDGTITAKSINATDGSKVYGISAIEIVSEYDESSGAGLIKTSGDRKSVV